MRSRVKKKQPDIAHYRPTLNQINELSMCVFIVMQKEEQKLSRAINDKGGKVVSVTRGIGVSRSSIFQSLKIGTDDVCVFFSVCRVEDVKNFMQEISSEFRLNEQGRGKGFVIDIDGYLGAKALFVE